MHSLKSVLYLLAALLCLGTMAGAPAGADAESAMPGDIPAISDTDLEQALELAGSNRPELQAALDYCRQKPLTMAAMRFMVAGLPLADLGVISADELIEHVELAMQARHEMKYGMDYSDAVCPRASARSRSAAGARSSMSTCTSWWRTAGHCRMQRSSSTNGVPSAPASNRRSAATRDRWLHCAAASDAVRN